jgi:hypothetical protein
MTAIDIAFARTRSVARPLTLALAAGALAWTAFITYELAARAYKLGKADHLLRGLHLVPELKVMLGAAAIAAAAGIAVAAVVPRLLAALKLAAAGAAVIAMCVLAVTSHQTAEVAAFAGLTLWCWWVGSPVLAALEAPVAIVSGAGRTALATLLGFAVLSFAMLVIALPGALSDAGMAAVLVAGGATAAAGWIALKPSSRVPSDSTPLVPRHAQDEREGGFIEYLALALVMVTLVVSFGASLAPQVQFDALHYHFAMPRIFLAEGRFVERPDIIQGYFPLGLEMTYVPALRFGGETTMTLMNWATTPVLLALVWSAGDRTFGRPSGALAAALMATAALVVFESSSASSDIAMTAWVVAAAIALGAYAARPSPRLALAAGLFGGLALTFKIVAGIYVIPLALAFVAALIFAARPARREGLRHAAAFAAGGLLTGAPWLLLRLIQTGNPVFPLYNDIFESDKWPPVRERFDLWLYGVGHSPGDAGSVWWEVAAHPWRFGQWLPPWSMGLPVLAFVAAALMAPSLFRGKPAAMLGLLAVLAAGSWFLLSQYHRYGLPAFSLLAIAGAAATWLALRQLHPRLVAPAASLLVAIWFAGGTVLALVMGVPDPYPTDVVLGHESREAYRDRSTADYFPLRFVEERMKGTDDAAAIVGFPYNYFVTNRLYDYTEPSTLSPFTRAATSGATPEQTAKDLLAARVRWLIVDYNPVAGQSPWPPADLTAGVLSEAFIKAHTEVAFEKYGVVVYRVIGP